MKPMGFALWIDAEIAWAQGIHEYRPMGVAIIAATDLFSARDFKPRRPSRPRNDAAFAGLFASLEQVNRFLVERRSQGRGKKSRRGSKRSISII